MIILQVNPIDSLPSNLATGQETELSLSFWELAIKGGWIMIPIALLSIVAI